MRLCGNTKRNTIQDSYKFNNVEDSNLLICYETDTISFT